MIMWKMLEKYFVVCYSSAGWFTAHGLTRTPFHDNIKHERIHCVFFLPCSVSQSTIHAALEISIATRQDKRQIRTEQPSWILTELYEQTTRHSLMYKHPVFLPINTHSYSSIKHIYSYCLEAGHTRNFSGGRNAVWFEMGSEKKRECKVTSAFVFRLNKAPWLKCWIFSNRTE